MSWIRARFIGTCIGERLGVAGEADGARRYSFELHSGRVFDLQSVDEPDQRDGEYRQPRLKRVRFPDPHAEPQSGSQSDDPPHLAERTLFDVRIRDWHLKYPAEAKGRSYATMEGVLLARLQPEAAQPEPLPIQPPELPDSPMPGPDFVPDAKRAPSDPEALSETRYRQRSSSHHFDARAHYARLRVAFAVAAVVGIAAGLAFFCSLQTAVVWLAPVVVALGLRSLLQRYLGGTPGLQGWLGASLILLQGYFLLEPIQFAWRLGCRIPIREDLILIAAPFVVAALIKRAWPLFITAFVWTGVMCAWCAELNGTCAALPEPMRVPIAASVAPRTDADGRWPAMPGSSLSGGGAPGGSDSGIERAAQPGSDSGRNLARDGADADLPGASLPGTSLASRARSADDGGVAGFEAAPFDASSARDSARWGSERSSSSPPASRDPEASSQRRSSIEGGWISSDYRSAKREMSLISVEHANRSPDSFFESGGRRRVYLPTDEIFDRRGTQVSQKGSLQLARLAALLSLHPDRRAVIELHTDASGSEVTQLRTSELRAGAVREWLVSRGNLAPDQIQAVGVGARRPLVPPDGSYGAQQPNRRIEVHLPDFRDDAKVADRR